MDTPDLSAPKGHLDGSSHNRLWRSFLINITLVLLIFTLGAFVGILSSHERLIQGEMLFRAQAHFKDILLTRRWNAFYGGVYVEKKAGVVSNPYLKNPDITATNGKVYTLKNPALMTREISELAEKEGDYRYHITSLNLRNPNNSPDGWEKEALLSFEKGNKEVYDTVVSDTGTLYRYMAPLFVEEKCLECHQDQGYKLGDVRGGISVSFDITHIQQRIEKNRVLSVLLTVVLIGLLLSIIYYFIAKVYRQLDAALVKLREMATTDSLTGLFNRGYFFSRLADEVSRHKRYQRDLACIFIDLDHFKKINDHHGHAMGDEALRAVARVLQKRCRNEDICARYGGEELIILLPETSLTGAHFMAQEVLQQVAEISLPLPSGKTLSFTASIGVACILANSPNWDTAADDLLSQADKGVYLAKSQGRNRIVVVEE